MILSTLDVFRYLWTILHSPDLEDTQKPEPASIASAIDLKKLATPSDLAFLPTIEYAYDPLPAQARYLKYSPCLLPRGTIAINEHTSLNSVKLNPFSAGLPYRSNIDHVRASKHWAANFGETLKLLDLLAADNSVSDIEVKHGITLSKLARSQLRPGRENQMALATHYMFPSASEDRMRQIAALTILYFVFDDKVEETPNNKLHIFRDDFLRRLEGHCDPKSKPSPLQSHIDSIIQGIENEDSAGGNGGKEMIEALHSGFRYVRPNDKGFQTVSEYLHFRRENVGAAFVIAAAKFSIKSSVSTTSARFSRFLHLISNHLGIVNDLASYDKELRALERGETADMINLVHVIKHVTGLKGTDDAKAVVWALQLQVERKMMEELEGLKRKGGVSDEEWWFLEAVMGAAVGNVMFCMTTSRYGGEGARILKA